MNADLSLQTPALAWSSAQGDARLPGLGWVDGALDPDARPFSLNLGEDGEVRFAGTPLAAQLPPSVAARAAEAQAAGEPTAWEGLSLLLARAEWTVASRGLLWAPATAAPGLLASLVESAGVDAGLHRGDPDRLRRLAALLPAWRPARGSAASAVALLAAADEGWQAAALVEEEDESPDEDITAPSPAGGEVFVARGEGWWRRRVEGAGPELRIQGGVLRASARGVAQRREDLLIHLDPDGPAPRDLYRLLPVWTVPRPLGAAAPEKSP